MHSSPALLKPPMVLSAKQSNLKPHHDCGSRSFVVPAGALVLASLATSWQQRKLEPSPQKRCIRSFVALVGALVSHGVATWLQLKSKKSENTLHSLLLRRFRSTRLARLPNRVLKATQTCNFSPCCAASGPFGALLDCSQSDELPAKLPE